VSPETYSALRLNLCIFLVVHGREFGGTRYDVNGFELSGRRRYPGHSQLPTRSRELGARQVIAAERDRPRECCLIGAGFAFRSKTTSEGSRQILSLHISGEIPDLQSLHLRLMDHDLVTLTRCQLKFVPHEAILPLTRAPPNVSAALQRKDRLMRRSLGSGSSTSGKDQSPPEWRICCWSFITG
jgi:hypothetical protein